MNCEKMPSGGQRTIGRHVVISLCAACTGCIGPLTVVPANSPTFASALPARGASLRMCAESSITEPLPRRCLHGVHHIDKMSDFDFFTLPRRCLHGVHHGCGHAGCDASALPRRCLHGVHPGQEANNRLHGRALPRRCLHGVHRNLQLVCLGNGQLCLGAACTGCIALTRSGAFTGKTFASALPARGASAKADKLRHTFL